MKKVKMLNSFFGNVMYVAEDRVEEYKSAGHRLADAPKPTESKPPKREKKKRSG